MAEMTPWQVKWFVNPDGISLLYLQDIIRLKQVQAVLT